MNLLFYYCGCLPGLCFLPSVPSLIVVKGMSWEFMGGNGEFRDKPQLLVHTPCGKQHVEAHSTKSHKHVVSGNLHTTIYSHAVVKMSRAAKSQKCFVAKHKNLGVLRSTRIRAHQTR